MTRRQTLEAVDLNDMDHANFRNDLSNCVTIVGDFESSYCISLCP